jgi:hypothetical protein
MPELFVLTGCDPALRLEPPLFLLENQNQAAAVPFVRLPLRTSPKVKTVPEGAVLLVISGMAANAIEAGVTLLLAAVYAPVPTLLIAATRKTYAVPFVSPVTVALVAVDVPSAKVVHVEPLLLENSTA